MAFVTKPNFFGWLQSLYGLTASVVSGVINTVVTGTLIVRQPGGTAGSDELQISDNGTRTTIKRMEGGLGAQIEIYLGSRLPILIDGTASSNTSVRFCNGHIAASDYSTLKGIGVSSGSTIFFGSGAGDAENPDTVFSRIAANIAGMSSGDWFQQVAGRSRVTGDITNVTITPAAITGLSATLIAGRKYTGRMVLFCNETTAADGLRLDYDGGTATATTFIAQGCLTDDNGFQAIARTTALATDTTNTTITGSTVVTIEFCIVCNAAGTFIPRFAKEADAAGAALTVSNGSYMWIEDMPA